jgi:hypothetical protein
MDWTTALVIWAAMETASKTVSMIKNAASAGSYLSRLFKKIDARISRQGVTPKKLLRVTGQVTALEKKLALT